MNLQSKSKLDIIHNAAGLFDSADVDCRGFAQQVLISVARGPQSMIHMMNILARVSQIQLSC